ncbi:MAG: helix-hairpin-helix domain-containing protein [Desulfobacterales bacterium]|jgi:exodeoxyribonuclease V alpha subunit|nr:helix-hairpin-helix domain-containing protein [Desulfobacterales bacterium]
MAAESQSVQVGSLKKIIFKKIDTGFLIGSFSDESGKEFVAIGTMVNPEEQMAYKLTGTWVKTERYGEQFKFNWYEVKRPDDVEGIYRYLVRITKWVGPKVANALLKQYGDDTLNVLKNDPEKVAGDIRGITLERALEIKTALISNEKIESTLIELERIFSLVPGIKKSLPMDLIQAYGANAVEKIKENPYVITKIRKIGFLTADRLAMAIGMDPRDSKRAMAAVLHVLLEAQSIDGSTWVAFSEIEKAVNELIGNNPYDGLARLLKNGDIVARGYSYALAPTDRSETEIAVAIKRLLSAKNESPSQSQSQLESQMQSEDAEEYEISEEELEGI